MDQDAARIKMQQGSRCNEDQDATWTKMQRGSRSNEDEVVLLVRAGGGRTEDPSSEDQDTTRIKMR